MSVRRRTWTTQKGERREAWIVDYTDQAGERHIETFAKKGEAAVRHNEIGVGVRAGTHVATSKSITVSEAGDSWLTACRDAGLERATIKTYGEQLAHIVLHIGRVKLSAVTIPVVRRFQDSLRKSGLSQSMVRRVTASLGSILADAQERGQCASNAVRDITRNGKHKRRVEKRQAGKVESGVDYPTPDEIKRLLSAVQPRWRPVMITAIFTGLRASELRGLRWSDVNLKSGEITVRQRADRFNVIGKPKSVAAIRTVPMGPFVANTLREWRLACPKGNLDLVFPTGSGNVECLQNIIHRGLIPACIAAGIVKDGNPKYTGFHALRHFFASWCINRKEDGGRGLPPKMVQRLMGHSTIVMTLDFYGHLFPEVKDDDELAAAELALIA